MAIFKDEHLTGQISDSIMGIENLTEHCSAVAEQAAEPFDMYDEESHGYRLYWQAYHNEMVRVTLAAINTWSTPKHLTSATRSKQVQQITLTLEVQDEVDIVDLVERLERLLVPSNLRREDLRGVGIDGGEVDECLRDQVESFTWRVTT